MSVRYISGFTIIETMLFLGISGLLVMGILVGSGVSINIQRYRDSVNTMQSVIKSQYNSVTNVSNDRDDSWSCNSNGSLTQTTPGGGEAVGQSDCVILGKYIVSSDNGSSLTIKDVVGYMPSNSTISLDDIEVFLKNGDGTTPGYIIKVSDVAISNYDLEWGASTAQAVPNDSKPYLLSMLILRSPNSGTIRTFISSDINNVVSDDNISSIISSNSLEQSAKICINSNGLFTGAKMAILVNANSSNSNGVEILGDDSGC